MRLHVLGAIAVSLAVLALPAIASADTRIAADKVTDATGGATVTAELWQRSSDGAVYPKVWVKDSGADGICPHGRIDWKHNNGNWYSDTGMWVCGYGKTAGPFFKGARNWTQYQSVYVTAYVDGGPARSVPLRFFAGTRSRQPSGDPDATPDRPGGNREKPCGFKVKLRALVVEAAAQGGAAPGRGDRGGGLSGDAKDRGVQRVGLVQNCIERTRTHVFARTWIDLDDGWELAQEPMRIRTELVDTRSDKRAGRPAVLGVKTGAFGKSLDGRPWLVTRVRGSHQRVEGHNRWNKPGSVYKFESEPIRRDGRHYTTRTAIEFVKTAFKNTTKAPLAVYWGMYGPKPCERGERKPKGRPDCGFYRADMRWYGGYVTG